MFANRHSVRRPPMFAKTRDDHGLVANAQSKRGPRTKAGYPGTDRHWTPAPADHLAISVVDRRAIPIAVGPWQRFPIGGVVHIARRRIGRPLAGADSTSDAARIRRDRHGGNCG